MKPVVSATWIDRLCTACGLCCDGTLFRDVRLTQADAPNRLRRLGLTLEKRGTRTCLTQPCTAFDGALCTLYADRPSRCRAFECRVLQRVANGSLDLPSARRHIRRARALVDAIQNDLVALGNHETSRPLLERYATVMASPIDLSEGAAAGRRRGRLLTRVDTFMRLAQSEFLAV